MWSRVVELMLGCWLLISPFVFRHALDQTHLWSVDLLAGSVVIVCALLSYASTTLQAHLVTLGVAILLIAFAASQTGIPAAAEGPVPAALQNHVLTGLLILMMSLVPNDASQPPPTWKKVGSG